MLNCTEVAAILLCNDIAATSVLSLVVCYLISTQWESFLYSAMIMIPARLHVRE